MNIPIRQLKKAYSRSSFVPRSYHLRTTSQTNINNRSFFLNQPTQNIIQHTKNNIDIFLMNLGGSQILNLNNENNLSQINLNKKNKSSYLNERNNNEKIKRFKNNIPFNYKKLNKINYLIIVVIIINIIKEI